VTWLGIRYTALTWQAAFLRVHEVPFSDLSPYSDYHNWISHNCLHSAFLLRKCRNSTLQVQVRSNIHLGNNNHSINRRTTWTNKSIIDEPRIMIKLEVLHYNIVPCFRKGEGQIFSEITVSVGDSQWRLKPQPLCFSDQVATQPPSRPQEWTRRFIQKWLPAPHRPQLQGHGAQLFCDSSVLELRGSVSTRHPRAQPRVGEAGDFLTHWATGPKQAVLRHVYHQRGPQWLQGG